MDIIGQKQNIITISNWQVIPNFMIVTGESGSGKKTLVKYIANEFNAELVVSGNKIDDIRNIISDSTQLVRHRIYMLSGSNMSLSAKNTLLKITEEPPPNCHIAVLVQTEQELLDTLISRSQLLTVLPYTVEEVIQYLEEVGISHEQAIKYSKLSNSFGDFNKLLKYGIEEYLEKTEFFLDNIWKVSYANALKIADWLKLSKKDEDDESKLDCELFVSAVYNYFYLQCLENSDNYDWFEVKDNLEFIRITSKCLTTIQKQSISKAITVNTWLKELTDIG